MNISIRATQENESLELCNIQKAAFLPLYEKYRDESAKMLAASYLFLKGTPFIYQGQEIGMSNWYPEDPEMYEDVQTRWQYFNVATKRSPEKRLQRLWHGSRDSARTPVQWSAEENAGFTTGTPWFYVNENYVDVNVAAQEADENSVLKVKSLDVPDFGWDLNGLTPQEYFDNHFSTAHTESGI